MRFHHYFPPPRRPQLCFLILRVWIEKPLPPPTMIFDHLSPSFNPFSLPPAFGKVDTNCYSRRSHPDSRNFYFKKKEGSKFRLLRLAGAMWGFDWCFNAMFDNFLRNSSPVTIFPNPKNPLFFFLCVLFRYIHTYGNLLPTNNY